MMVGLRLLYNILFHINDLTAGTDYLVQVPYIELGCSRHQGHPLNLLTVRRLAEECRLGAQKRRN